MPFREESCRSSCIYSGPLHSYSRDAVSQHPSTRAGAESIQLIYSGRALQALSDLARQFRCHPIFWRESIIGQHTWKCQILTHVHTKMHTHTRQQKRTTKSRRETRKKRRGVRRGKFKKKKRGGVGGKKERGRGMGLGGYRNVGTEEGKTSY